MKKILLAMTAFLVPFINFAQEVQQEPGLDQQINDWFAPFANWWESVVLYAIPITDSISVPIVLILLIGGATFFTIRFGFVNIRHFMTSINTIRGKHDEFDHHEPINPKGKETVSTTEEGDIVDTIKVEGKDGEVSHFQALCAGLSGTIGLGNIAGVAVAIAIGGPGATFWIIIGGLLGMSAKFVECTLGVTYRDVEPDGTVHGGPMYYLHKGLKEKGMGGFGKVLAVIFAVMCVGASFGGGNAFQSNQVAGQVITLFGLEGGGVGVIIGCVLAFLVGIVIIGGIKRIASWAEKIVPIMAVLYVVSGLIIVGMHFELIGPAFSRIIGEAFTPQAGLGGFVGVMIVGFQRAAFSNEAGAGTSPIAHAAVKTKYPASEGFVAMIAPFLDTVIVCTMTALVIVFFNMNDMFVYGGDTGNVTLIESTGGMMAGDVIGGVSLTSVAFESAIPHFGIALTIAVILFAFSTLISWSYYGIQSWKYLFGKSKASDITYKVLFLLFIIAGAGATLDAVITFSDAMILALVFPNMIGLLFLFPVVRKEMKKYLSAIKIGKAQKKEREARGE
ncbi:MAG TPA: alanine/glycine:cation symporter family protein [Flavobacteriaceae bacterium]|nr:alanine/glycine:cation symporter family protein [Flavobacteriaceae bacterium]